MFQIEEWTPALGSGALDLEMLAGVLHNVVHNGGTVSFILPFTETDARAYWDKVAQAVEHGTRRVLVARCEGRIAGTVQLELGTPPNQKHRAEIMKLLVHSDFRRRGIARALMEQVEQMAAAEGRTLLTLDTRTGSFAEPLYLSMGYVVAGRIPGFSREPDCDVLSPTTILYKQIRAAA
ncbi:MAG: GNAT family N-acetyltransferase [Bryobacterales bacterium]|nr:GNAT family N-acetyltransferase [Bryobacterales bacterium]